MTINQRIREFYQEKGYKNSQLEKAIESFKSQSPEYVDHWDDEIVLSQQLKGTEYTFLEALNYLLRNTHIPSSIRRS